MATTIKQFNLNGDQGALAAGQRAERKLLITVAEWTEKEVTTPPGGGDPVETEVQVREILGTRTEDSSIEYNPDIETSTDIRGINYTDMNKTQPQQSFDPYLVLGGSRLGAFLNDIRKRNAVSELNQFTMYIITAFVGEAGKYETEVHQNCTITYDSLGGDTRVNFPITVYFSNNYGQLGRPATGYVDKLSDDFTFTQDV